MTPFTTPIFDFHLVTSALTTSLTTPTPTPSLEKISLKKASAVDPENWLGLLIDRASRKICFSQSKALPRSGQWHNWHQYEISAAFVPHALGSFRRETSGGITKYDCFLRLYVVGLVSQPCLSVLLFLKFILQNKTASKWVPCDCCTALPSGNWKR